MDGVVQSRQRKGNQKAVVKELFPRLKKMLHGNMKTNSLLQWDELPTIGLYSIYTYVLHFGIFLQGKKKRFNCIQSMFNKENYASVSFKTWRNSVKPVMHFLGARSLVNSEISKNYTGAADFPLRTCGFRGLETKKKAAKAARGGGPSKRESQSVLQYWRDDIGVKTAPSLLLSAPTIRCGWRRRRRRAQRRRLRRPPPLPRPYPLCAHFTFAARPPFYFLFFPFLCRLFFFFRFFLSWYRNLRFTWTTSNFIHQNINML